MSSALCPDAQYCDALMPLHCVICRGEAPPRPGRSAASPWAQHRLALGAAPLRPYGGWQNADLRGCPIPQYLNT